MRISIIFMLFLFLIVNGCKSDVNPKKEITVEDLMGEWEIYYATRNGNVTKSLENGNIVFHADNLVSSNLFSSVNNLNFTFDNGAIHVEGEPNMATLKIVKLQNDTLVVSSKMKVFNMEFYMTKK